MKRVFDLGSGLAAAGAAVASATASVCCLGPAAIALLGVEGAILAAGIKPYRGPLLATSLGLLVLGFWGAYRPWERRSGSGRNAVEIGKACRPGARRRARIVLWIAAAVWVGAVLTQWLVNLTWLGGKP